MVNLLAKLDLDSTGFFRGLSRATEGAKKAGDKIGQEVGKDFTKAIKRTLGAGALVGSVLALFKDSQEIRNTAAALGVTAQEFAAMELVAKRLGDTTNVTTDEFRRLTQEVIDSGEVADSNSLARLAADADRFEAALMRVKAAATAALGTVARFVEAWGAGVGGFWSSLDPSKSTGIMDRFRQFGQFFNESWNAPVEGTSLAERAQRTTPPEKEAKSKGEATAKAEREERRRLGLPSTPFAERSGGSLASIGLGPGLGTTFNLQRQMLDEQRRQTAQIRALALEIRRQNGGPL